MTQSSSLLFLLFSDQPIRPVFIFNSKTFEHKILYWYVFIGLKIHSIKGNMATRAKLGHQNEELANVLKIY